MFSPFYGPEIPKTWIKISKIKNNIPMRIAPSSLLDKVTKRKNGRILSLNY